MSKPLSQRSHRNRKTSRKWSHISPWGKATKSWKRWTKGENIRKDLENGD